MTYVSYFFAAMAVLSGIAALAIFFIYDIKTCWQILKGGRGLAPSVKKLSHGEGTERLDAKLDEKAHEQTVLLDMEATEPLGTMVMVQEITMIEAE